MSETTQERSVPKPVFTDAEAGAKTFPDSDARRFNYYTPAKRKQSHYEDVTVEVQPDPRHYLSQGWLYGFSDGRGGYPLDWTALKAWGSDRPEPERYPGSGGKGYDWPAHGWHEFRDPNEEWELTLYRYNSNVVRQLNQNIDNARQSKAFDQWNRNWVRFVERNVGAWMHVDHGLGLYLYANANRRAPDQHAQQRDLGQQHAPDPGRPGPGPVQPHAHRGDRRLRRRRASGRVEHRPGLAGRPRGRRAAHRHRRLVRGDLRRERGLRAAGGRAVPQPAGMHAAPRNGDFVTPTIVGAAEYDFAERDLRYTSAMFELLAADREFADHNKAILRQWLSAWVPRCLTAARTLQPMWSQPDAKPPRFEDGLDAAKSRFTAILSELSLEAPKELAQ